MSHSQKNVAFNFNFIMYIQNNLNLWSLNINLVLTGQFLLYFLKASKSHFLLLIEVKITSSPCCSLGYFIFKYYTNSLNNATFGSGKKIRYPNCVVNISYKEALRVKQGVGLF